ncbi:hypothetical protein ACWC9T_37500 [Kitasatospora sp. NPDC001159]
MRASTGFVMRAVEWSGPAEMEDGDGDRLVVDLVLNAVEADLDAVDPAGPDGLQL